MTKDFIQAGELKLHVATEGDPSGEPVYLLHGYPEFWYGWRNQIPFLSEKGYFVVAPDQRGYNLSDKPKGVENYSIGKIARDVVNIADTLGHEKINLIGHDWGAAVAWMVATIYPDRLNKLVILNAPYPPIMARAFRSGNLNQLLKSWYMFFFRIPALPEFVLSANNYAGMTKVISRAGNGRMTFTDAELEKYREAWRQPGAMTSMLNWYRAVFRRGSGKGHSRRPTDQLCIHVPTLMLWGEKDPAFAKDLANASINICEKGQIVFFPTASHWLQHEEADAVNEHIVEFLMAS